MRMHLEGVKNAYPQITQINLQNLRNLWTPGSTASGASGCCPNHGHDGGVCVPIGHGHGHGRDLGDCVRRYCRNANLDSVRDHPNVRRVRRGS